MAPGYYAELGSSKRVLYLKGNCEGLTIGADNPKTATILRFTLLLATFEGGLFCCARLYVCVFERVPGTCFVSLNKVLAELAICAYLFHSIYSAKRLIKVSRSSTERDSARRSFIARHFL